MTILDRHRAHRAVRASVAVILGAAILGLTTLVILAQTGRSPRRAPPQPSNPQSHVHHRPGSIVGSETPQRIPTEIAFGLLLRTVASLAGSDASAQDRQAMYFNRMEQFTRETLLASDRQFLESAAAVYVEQTDFGQLATRRAEVISQLWASSLKSLSPSGQQALQRYLDYMKLSIKILK